MSQLQPLDLVDFTGGLNTRRTEFSLGENESPGMLNIEVDPRGGIFTRKGWSRFNDADIVSDPETWSPRSAHIVVPKDGGFSILVSNGTTIYETDSSGDTVDTGIVVGGSDCLADFAQWGDAVYIATGLANQAYKRESTVNTALARTYNDDYTTPADGTMPRCEFIEPHGSYLFAASIDELVDVDDTGTGTQRSRVRWSHPSKPEDWATQDYIDIEVGGGSITGLLSFKDHLLIFKTDSVWALYGYSSDSFQLVLVSGSLGAPTTTGITRSESAVYFFSASQRGGIYAYTGDEPIEISEKIRDVMEDITVFNDVWLGWVGRRLWCSLPYDDENEGGIQSVFVFDPQVGQGAWVRHSPHVGNLTCIIEDSDVQTLAPLAVIDGTSGTSAILRLDFIDGAYDSILPNADYAVYLTDVDGNLIVVNDTDDPPTYLIESATYLGGAGFETLYRTRWIHAGWPERRKSWRRPRFVLTQQEESVLIDVNTNQNYNSNSSSRQHTLAVDPKGTVFWRALGADDPLPFGFDWGDGSLWGESGADGSTLKRAPSNSPGLGGLGVARSVQLEFKTSPITTARKWGINAIFLKYRLRGYTS